MAPDLTPCVLQLYRECFEGMPEGDSGTWFVEGKEGIFDALDTIDSGEASAPRHGAPTIAAHTYHILYTQRVANAYIGGIAPEGDWESTWAKQTVNDAEWDALRQDVHREYSFFMEFFKEHPELPNAEVGIGFTAQLPHMAYHLGAIRQLLQVRP